MKRALFLCALSAALVTSAPVFAETVPITILNPSFELDPGVAYPVYTPPSDWTSDAPFRDPIIIAYVDANRGFLVAPDGTKHLLIDRGHSESQTIDPKYYTPAVGDILTLTVAVAQPYIGSVALTLDGDIAAANSTSTTGAPKYPNFADATATYRITQADLGKSVGVKLTTPQTADDADFDNVRLKVTRGEVPSPQVIADLASNAVAPVIRAPRKGVRVFSCGHSFHFLNYSLPDLLQEIARSAGFPDHEIVGQSVIFGSKVIQHWDVKDADNRAKAALKAGAVDVLTLTTLYLPDDGIEKFAELGFRYNPNIRVTIQENWLPFDADNPRHFDPPLEVRPATVDHNAATVKKLDAIHKPYFSDLDKLVSSINHKLGKQVVFVVPVGQAVIALRGKVIAGKVPGAKTQEELFADTLGHPKAVIQTLIGYCHFAVIYRKNPIGLPVPSILAKSNIPPADQDALNRLLQELAWDAVTHHPLSGVRLSR